MAKTNYFTKRRSGVRRHRKDRVTPRRGGPSPLNQLQNWQKLMNAMEHIRDLKAGEVWMMEFPKVILWNIGVSNFPLAARRLQHANARRLGLVKYLGPRRWQRLYEWRVVEHGSYYEAGFIGLA